MSDSLFDMDFGWGPDSGPDLHDGHVQTRDGFDLSIENVLHEPELALCPWCVIAPSPLSADEPTLLTNEERYGVVWHYVICGACGACGPCERKESEAVRRWNLIGGAGR